MTLTRRLILAAVLIAGFSPAFAQVPPPVPALPDTERRTSYSISGSNCACLVNFDLYGDSTDYANWLSVWVDGVQQIGNWAITSPSGSLATLPRPITDAVLTFSGALTGTVQIVGARRPRRTSQFAENRGVSARDLNQVITDLTAQNREFWDRQARTVQAPPGETLSVLSPLAGRANMGACFDSGGNLVSCVGSSAGSFSAGTGITFTGTNPTVISWNGSLLGSNFMTEVTSGPNGPTIKVGTNGASGDDSALLITRALTPASGDLNSHGLRDETIATINVTGGAFSGYASFDSAYQVIGSAVTHQNHIHGFQARQIWNAAGIVDEWAGLTTQPVVINGAGIIQSAYGVLCLGPSIVAGGIVNNYCYYANTQLGPTNSYFLYQGGVGNPSVLPGDLYLGGRTSKFNVEKANLQYDGSTATGMSFLDTYAGVASLVAVTFIRNNSTVGTISESLTGTSYNMTSDERLKEFHGSYDAKEAERIIRADPVRRYTWRKQQIDAIGWGAQHSYSLHPSLASPGDEENRSPDDPKFKPWGIDFGRRTPFLWAAMTDVLDRLDAIEQRINHAESISRPANNAGLHYPRLGPNDGAAKAN